MGHQHNARVMYAFSFILQLVYALAQNQYLDEYIFKLAERTSSQGNLAVGAIESIGGITKLLVAWSLLGRLLDAFRKISICLRVLSIMTPSDRYMTWKKRVGD